MEGANGDPLDVPKSAGMEGFDDGAMPRAGTGEICDESSSRPA